MTALGLRDLNLTRDVAYYPWGCVMCKFHGRVLPHRLRFPPSADYTNEVFVKVGDMTFFYDHVARTHFPDFHVTPRVRLLVERDRTQLREFQAHAPRSLVPARRLRRWLRRWPSPLYGSVVPLYRNLTKHDCARFQQRRDYALFQVVFLDYLFGDRDRVANCFWTGGAYVTLDTGFSADPRFKANFGSRTDHLQHHVAQPHLHQGLCFLRAEYVGWHVSLQRFAARDRWLPHREKLAVFEWSLFRPSLFERVERTVLERSRELRAVLARC